MDLKIGDFVSPEQAMKLAIQEAWKGVGGVKTNPLVGCSIVSQEGRLLSLGYHSIFGEAHAEIKALDNLKDKEQLSGAKVFVTLEPCRHIGQTPSCAHRLCKLPIQSVVYGCKDPHPMARGGGEILMQHGIQVELYKGLEWELRELNEVFLHNISYQEAFVCLKVATSLDGLLALRNGQSQWISNKASREKGHHLRARYDAVLIGVNTYLNDNPYLNIRHPRYKGLKSKVIVLDPRGRSLPTLKNSHLWKVHAPEDIHVVTREGRGFTGVHIHRVEGSVVDLRALSRDLYKNFLISSILVEGGATTHSQFIAQGVAQKVHQFIAPVILGGGSGVNWTKGVNVGSMEDKIVVEVGNVEPLGDNILITGYFN